MRAGRNTDGMKLVPQVAPWFFLAALGLVVMALAAHAQSYVMAPNGDGQPPTVVGKILYAQTAPVSVNTSTPTSVFASGSTSARTFGANTLTAGRQFDLAGGGIYSVPTANTLAADIILKVGTATIVSITTPAAPVGTNAGIDFKASCVVQSGGTTMICTGLFLFVLAGATPVPVPFNSVTAKTFDPTVSNLVEVTGDWNGTVTTHVCTVQTATLAVRN